MASILLIDDEQSFAAGVAELLRVQGHSVVTADSLSAARQVLDQQSWDLMLIDLMLPDGNGLELLDELGDARPKQVVIITGHPGIKNTIRDLHGPGLGYLTKPIDVKEIISIADGLEEARESGVELHFGVLVGESAPMQALYEQIRQVAPTDTTVLINRESGTGKELVARALHTQSRRPGQFLAINCGALSKDLVASELFGHEKGSFTGANKRHVGAFERATTGTLFLDEITEMPIEQQPHLLRALETQTITRVGGEAEIPYDARIVTASNRDLGSAIEDGVLREDLYFRLNIFPISLPPLRERKSDIGLLAGEFLAQLNRKYGAQKVLDADGVGRLEAWHWPGNVRELQHTVHRCFITTTAPDAVLEIPEKFAVDVAGSKADPLAPGRSIKQVEKDLILNTLAHFEGNRAAAAETLGISLKTLYNRLTEYDQDTTEVSAS